MQKGLIIINAFSNYDLTLLLLIFMRMSGCVLLNPILGRKNIPVIVRVGLTLMLTIFSYKTVPDQTIEITSFLVLFVTLLEQLLIGFMVGYIIQLFLSIILISGENMDMQIGISMSKIYDPQSNVSMPLSASLINTLFILIFFITNGHLTLIKIFTRLCTLVPYQGVQYNPDMFRQLAGLFSLILIYAMKMTLPVLAAEFIAEIAIGLIMRAVPQIDVFTISIQLKVIIGFILLIVMVPPLATFIDRLITLMFDDINNVVFKALTA